MHKQTTAVSRKSAYEGKMNSLMFSFLQVMITEHEMFVNVELH